MKKTGGQPPVNQSREYFLIAIIPPSNISRQIDLIRERLFSDYCLVSAAALPPFIPLLFLPSGRYTLQEAQLKEKISKAFSITTGHYRECQGNLFLAVDSNGGYDCLKQELKNYLLAGTVEKAGSPKVPFPCFEGFFLAAPEGLSHFSRVIEELGTPDTLHFSSFSLVLLKIESYSEPDEWWQNIRWEETTTLNCRKTTKKSAAQS